MIGWWRYYRVVKAMEKLERLCLEIGNEELSRKLEIVRRTLVERRPYPFFIVSLTKALGILMPCFWRATIIWHVTPTLSWISERYPLEWKKAVVLCPELTKASEDEQR